MLLAVQTNLPDNAEQALSVLDVFDNRPWWHGAIVLALLAGPGFLAWLNTLLASRQLEKLYEKRIADKDAEITRLANNNKELQNQLFKRRRP